MIILFLFLVIRICRNVNGLLNEEPGRFLFTSSEHQERLLLLLLLLFLKLRLFFFVPFVPSFTSAAGVVSSLYMSSVT